MGGGAAKKTKTSGKRKATKTTNKAMQKSVEKYRRRDVCGFAWVTPKAAQRSTADDDDDAASYRPHANVERRNPKSVSNKLADDKHWA